MKPNPFMRNCTLSQIKEITMKPKSIDEKLHIVMDSGCNDKPKSIDEDLHIVTDSGCNDKPKSIDEDLQIVTDSACNYET